MDKVIKRIEGLTNTLKALQPIKPEYQSNLDKKFRIEFNYNSNHLEGNTLTYGETELLLIFEDTSGKHTFREYEEMNAHDAAYKLVKEWAQDTEQPLTETLIKNLNEVILVKPYWKDAVTLEGKHTRRKIKIGDYKEQPNSVILQNGERFDYTSPMDTPIQMAELIDWYRTECERKELHPVAIAALLHYKFVRIHPFDDGNGRVSRLLMNYVLIKNGLPPVVIKSADKRNYLFALNKADTGDIKSFVSYIAEQLIWSLEISIKAAQGESIEEPEDLEKEIAVWKKGLSRGEIVNIRRDDEVIQEMFDVSIKHLLREFDNRHKQLHELFAQTITRVYKNGLLQKSLDGLISEMEEMDLSDAATGFINEGATLEKYSFPKDSFLDFKIEIDLIEYKYDTSAFSIPSHLSINLAPYRYAINYRGREILEHDYTHLLYSDEINAIVAECVKNVFEEIKERAKKSK